MSYEPTVQPLVRGEIPAASASRFRTVVVLIAIVFAAPRLALGQSQLPGPTLGERSLRAYLARCAALRGREAAACYDRVAAEARRSLGSTTGPDGMALAVLCADALSAAGNTQAAWGVLHDANQAADARGLQRVWGSGARYRAGLDWRLAGIEGSRGHEGVAWRHLLYYSAYAWVCQRGTPLLALALWVVLWATPLAGARPDRGRPARAVEAILLFATPVAFLLCADGVRHLASWVAYGHPLAYALHRQGSSSFRSLELSLDVIVQLILSGLVWRMVRLRAPGKLPPPRVIAAPLLSRATTGAAVVLAGVILNHASAGGVIEAALNGAAIRPPAFDAVFVLTVVLSPIAEETLFRGSLYGLAESHRGPLYATTATALAFAASHGSLDGLFRVLWAGIVYGTVRALTGCVATSACVHSLGNLLARFTSWSDDWRWR